MNWHFNYEWTLSSSRIYIYFGQNTALFNVKSIAYEMDPFSPLTEIKLNGLRTHNEGFFHLTPKLLGFSRQFGQINFGAFGVPMFGRFISTHFGTVNPLTMFYRFKNLAFISQSKIFIWDLNLNLSYRVSVVCKAKELQKSMNVLDTLCIHK